MQDIFDLTAKDSLRYRRTPGGVQELRRQVAAGLSDSEFEDALATLLKAGFLTIDDHGELLVYVGT
jgi:hypothetical protein